MGDKAFFLQQNTEGVSLHGHLTELIHSLLTSKDPNALEKLESLSLDVKAKHFKAAEAGTKVCLSAPNLFICASRYPEAAHVSVSAARLISVRCCFCDAEPGACSGPE